MTSIHELEEKVALLEEQLTRANQERDAIERELDDIISAIDKLRNLLTSIAFKEDVNQLMRMLQDLGEFQNINLMRVML